ncbi:hypothetical protein [Sulfobacillus thermosulfidooxidans]|uniref:hypothetical protein n=1 Tax=Sulfobacillus thermosulfidooxidans TaxID=28034 RepID=UPI0006B44674|nr:hypothetical protein [Sulfobacillus thermosulfidooxidans]
MNSIPPEIQEFCREVDDFFGRFDLRGQTTLLQKIVHILKNPTAFEFLAYAGFGSPAEMVRPGLDLAAYIRQGISIQLKARQLQQKYPKEFTLWVATITDTGELFCGHWQ